MEDSMAVTAVKHMRKAIKQLIEWGYSESQIKKITACAIIGELLEFKTPEEKNEFLLKSDFYQSYLKSNIPDTQWTIDNILYRQNFYGATQKKKHKDFPHCYNDFLE